MAKRGLLTLIIIFLSCIQGYSEDNPLKIKKELLNSILVKNTEGGSLIPVLNRSQDAGTAVLDFLQELDEKKEYSLYQLSEQEIKLFNEAVSQLPPLHQRVINLRVMGIYFINNFMGNGYTEWFKDKNDRLYCWLVFNPAVLKRNFSETVTEKEKTCFINDSNDIKISINCGEQYSGLLYILMHEVTHAVDYTYILTPYIEKHFKNFRSNPLKDNLFMQDIWAEYDQPEEKYDFSARKNITFYGLLKGPKLKLSDAKNIYQDLSQTPFASLYGAQNWTEDLADFITFYHLTQKLKMPYQIRLYHNSSQTNLLFQYEPMNNPLLEKRFKVFNCFYL